MEISSTLHAVVAIFIGVIICIKAEASSSVNPTPIEANIEPLSPELFMPPLCEFLSPDLFTQTDPITYLRQKLLKLPYRKMTNMIEDTGRGLAHNLEMDRVPSTYVPYAEFLVSLSSCVHHLSQVKVFMRIIQRDIKPSQPWPDTASLKSELSPLFSSDIFLDNDPPSVLIDKLLATPETSFSSIARSLQRPEDDATRRFVQLYPWYSAHMSIFLQNETALKQLKNLKGDIAEIQKLKLSTSAVGQIKGQ